MSRTTFTKRPRSNLTPVQRPTVMVYAGLAYAAFAAAALWAIAFLADLSTRHAVDSASRRPAWTALLIDACLLLVFAVQHSVMARAGSKQRLARILPAATERSTYVLAASLALGLLFWQWQPLPASAWHVSAQPWTALIWVVYAAGWLLVVATTFMIDHLDFLGLRQAYAHTRQQPYQPPDTFCSPQPARPTLWSASNSKDETSPGTSALPTATTPKECQPSSPRHIAS